VTLHTAALQPPDWAWISTKIYRAATSPDHGDPKGEKGRGGNSVPHWNLESTNRRVQIRPVRMNRIRPELFGVSNRKRTVKRIHRESRSGAYLPLPRDCQLVGGHGRAAIQLLFLRRAVSNSCSNSPLPPAGRRRVTSRGRGSTTGSCWECSAMNGATGCQDSSRRVSASVYLGGRPTTQWLLTTNCRQSCSCSTRCICFF
jgi:hypothetical protein